MNDGRSAIYRKLLVGLCSLNRVRAIRYSSGVPTTRWGEAIARLLAERGWTKRHLADAASVRPNTLTNLIKHGKDSDTATLGRIAAAFTVDISELFLTREQSVVLQAHRESRVDRLREMVVKELTTTVARLVDQQVASGGPFSAADRDSSKAEYRYVRKSRKRQRPARR
ncbi:MAG TPA: helix-turn-helix transcriptional regulator [Vicinamibacterales bacterium]|nr:helix-turn-helix transcriptional regulator [Vicinamibacterales bacterium]